MWSELYYSLCNTKGRDAESQQISFGTVCQIRSAVGMYYTLDMQATYPQQVLQDLARWSLVCVRVSPWDKPSMTYDSTSLARRLGTEVVKSCPLSQVHIALMDDYLD
jgi:hypothetical protein